MPTQSGRLELVLERVQAFALFALAAFVSFSIAGAHISLGLLSVTVLLQVLLAQRTRWGGDDLVTRRAIPGLAWPVAAVGLSALISTGLSAAPRESLLHLKHLLIMVAIWAVSQPLQRRPGLRVPVLWVFIATATAASIWGLVKYGMGLTVRVQSTQSTTMTWGALAAMFAVLSLQVALALPSRRARWCARLLLVPQLSALLLSLVRGAYVGFATGVTFLVRVYWRRLLPVAAILVLLALVVMPAHVRERMASILDLQHPSTLVRLTQWQIAGRIVADHPLLGVGWRDLAPLTRQYGQPDPALPQGVNDDVFHIGHYHNTYVTYAVYFGLVGLLAFGWLMLQIWRNLAAANRAAAPPNQAIVAGCQAAMLAFLVTGLFDWTFGDAEVVTMFWFLVGLGLGQAPAAPRAAVATAGAPALASRRGQPFLDRARAK